MRSEPSPSLNALTKKVIGAAFTVSNTLGHGFLELVYRNALSEELALNGIEVQREKQFPVHYRGKQVGIYIADLVIHDVVIVELKAVMALAPAHAAQVLNYLKASRLPVGLLLNFGSPRLEVRRLVL